MRSQNRTPGSGHFGRYYLPSSPDVFLRTPSSGSHNSCCFICLRLAGSFSVSGSAGRRAHLGGTNARSRYRCDRWPVFPRTRTPRSSQGYCHSTGNRFIRTSSVHTCIITITYLSRLTSCIGTVHYHLSVQNHYIDSAVSRYPLYYQRSDNDYEWTDKPKEHKWQHQDDLE